MSFRTPTPTILSLPNELLVAIATEGQQGRVADLETAVNFKSEWTWSQVSRRLREAIIGAPTLWTLVKANLDAEGSVEIFKLYLERSRTCNISVHLQYLPDGGGSKQIIVAAERLRQIAPHIHRIWRLSIRLRKESELLAPLSNIAAPNLQHLEIFNRDYESSRHQGSLVEIFSSGAPRLTFVQMHGFRLSAAAPPWTASLTHLEVRGGSNDAGGNLLFAAQCPLLVHLVLDIGWFIPEHPVHLPSLKLLRISLSNSATDALLAMLNLFDTPVLDEFIVTSAHGDQIFALLTSASLHSFPALTSLWCVTRGSCLCEDHFRFSDTISSPPIQLFPILSSLTLINVCFAHNLVHEILGPTTQPWPLLRTVALCPRPGTLQDVHEALQNVMRSKRQRGQALPHFKLSADLLSSMEERVGTETFDPTDIIDSFC
ncbi:hypothetical protein B0H19DRAFT_1248011 [Mycena capillaripes]|nr:hypothetical protein B0H19DRAFT_1248011 [Mycena capillaripes]